jgi:hypothetical protein
MGNGPHGQPQPHVKHCPRCAGALINIPSRKKPTPLSHHYECSKCAVQFEINET